MTTFKTSRKISATVEQVFAAFSRSVWRGGGGQPVSPILSVSVSSRTVDVGLSPCMDPTAGIIQMETYLEK
jgi:hypothetical protein